MSKKSEKKALGAYLQNVMNREKKDDMGIDDALVATLANAMVKDDPSQEDLVQMLVDAGVTDKEIQGVYLAMARQEGKIDDTLD